MTPERLQIARSATLLSAALEVAVVAGLDSAGPCKLNRIAFDRAKAVRAIFTKRRRFGAAAMFWCRPYPVTPPNERVPIDGGLGMKPPSLSRAFAKLRDRAVKILHCVASLDAVIDLRDFVGQNAAKAWGRG